MSFDPSIGERDLNTFDSHQPPQPRCYGRSAKAKAVYQSGIGLESGTILIALSTITAIAALPLAYGGWSF